MTEIKVHSSIRGKNQFCDEEKGEKATKGGHTRKARGGRQCHKFNQTLFPLSILQNLDRCEVEKFATLQRLSKSEQMSGAFRNKIQVNFCSEHARFEGLTF